MSKSAVETLDTIDPSVGSKLVLLVSGIFVCGGLYGLILNSELTSGLPLILLYILVLAPIYRILRGD